MNKTLSATESAEKLDIHRSTLLKLMRDGLITPYIIGDEPMKMRFLTYDVEELLSLDALNKYRPEYILENHAFLTNTEEIPDKIGALVALKDVSALRHVLEAAQISRIFGSYLEVTHLDNYREAVNGMSEVWISEVIRGLVSENSSSITGHYELADKLTVFYGSVDWMKDGQVKKPVIAMLCYAAEEGDIIISGCLQPYMNIGKGLLLMERRYAENFFINMQEYSLDEFAVIISDDVYNRFMDEFFNEVYMMEIHEQES